MERRNQTVGADGEAAAAQHLRNRGWRVLDRNWRCDEGELDIVAHDGRQFVACEVKSRSNTRFGAPLEAITPAKAARLHRLARRWAAEHRVPVEEVRVDLLGLVTCAEGYLIEHVRGLA